MTKEERARMAKLIKNEPYSMRAVMYYREEGVSSLKWAGLYLLIVLATFFLPTIFPPTHKSWWGPYFLMIAQSLVIGVWSLEFWRQARRAFGGFALTYLGFKYRLLTYQITWEVVAVEYPGWLFVFTKDLEAYEDELRAYVRHYRRNLDRWKRERRWVEVGTALTSRLDDLFDRFALSESEKSEILARWNEIVNPQRKKKYLSRLESSLSHKGFVVQPVVMKLPPSFDSSGDLDSVRDHLMDVEKPKEKIQLLKEATRRLQRQIKSPSVPIDEKVVAEIKLLSLQDLAREKFSLMGVVPQKVNPIMAREIILALLEPGRQGRRFQAAYYGEASLRMRVRRHYEVHLKTQFNPRVFDDTLGWLARETVLFTKRKPNQEVYSLTSKTRGKSREAERVIRALLDFDRSFRLM